MKVFLRLDRYPTGSTMRLVVVVAIPGLGYHESLLRVRAWAHRAFPDWCSSVRTIRDDETTDHFDRYQKVILT